METGVLVSPFEKGGGSGYAPTLIAGGFTI